MNPSTKAALKARVHQYESLQKTLNFRGAQAPERLEHKCTYLEDLLRIYTQECEALVADKARLSLNNDADMAREIDLLSERNYLSSQQIRALHEENAQLRREKQEDLERATDTFRKQLQRHQDRAAAASAALQNENSTLKSKIEQLQALANGQKALASAEEEVRVVELKHQVEELRAELQGKTEQLAADSADRIRLEEELFYLRQQQHQLTQFIDDLQATATQVHEMRATSSGQTTQIVETLLRSSQHLLQDHVVAMKQADKAQSATNTALRTTAADTKANGSGGGAANDGVLVQMSETSRLLKERLEKARKPSTSEGAASDASFGAASASPGKPRVPLALQLASAIAMLQVALESQSVEVALAARVALDSHEATLKATQSRLLNSYAQCEHLAARTAELERQYAETKELCATERDRALNARDQALLQLRTRDLRDSRKITRHVETQTLQRLLHDADSVAAPSAGISAPAPPAASAAHNTAPGGGAAKR